MPVDFQDKRFLITGGTSGIGLATAKRLHDEGALVWVTGRSEGHLREAAELLGDDRVLRNDAADPHAAKALADTVRERAPTLHGAFLNAGFGRFQSLTDSTPEEFDQHYAVNVRGPLLHARALAAVLEDGGAVVLNTSVGRMKGLPDSHIYSSTKGAVRTLTRTLAREFAPRNIRVNAVCPGPIETNFFAETGLSEEEVQQFAEQIQQQVPLGRFGRAEEVAAVAIFLLSDDASYVTGTEYVVDGGMTQL